MFRAWKICFAAFLVLSFLSGPVFAQSDEGQAFEPPPTPEGGEIGQGYRKSSPVVKDLNPQTTNDITALIDASSQVCLAVPDVYQIGCLITFYRKAVAETPTTGPYAEIHQILTETLADLEDVAKKYRDPGQPAIRASVETGDGLVSSGRIRAIKPESVATAKVEALRIVAQTETRLLRSAEFSSGGQNEFARIAAAVESNKVLLRS